MNKLNLFVVSKRHSVKEIVSGAERIRKKMLTIRLLLSFPTCFLSVVVLLMLPGHVCAAKTWYPPGRILFEGEQSRVRIIKTPAGVILKITTDKQGRQTVKELDHEPG